LSSFTHYKLNYFEPLSFGTLRYGTTDPFTPPLTRTAGAVLASTQVIPKGRSLERDEGEAL